MSGDVNTKVRIDGDDETALGRLALLYNEGSAGKGSLINQCLRVGMLAREAGLADFLTCLDNEPEYQELSPLGKQKRAHRELSELFGARPQQPPAPKDENKTEAAPKPKPTIPGLGQ